MLAATFSRQTALHSEASHRPMNAIPSLPAELAEPGVRPADLLGFTLLIATLLHLALILGVSFTLAKPSQISKTLEITLSTFNSQEKPKEADFLAQNNQQGSGSLEKKAAPKTTERAPFQDTQVNKVTPATAPPPSKPQVASKSALTTRSPQQQKATTRREEHNPESDARPTPVFDSSQLSMEIASLEAQLAEDVQQYAKRPKILRLNAASTMRDKGAWYKEDWRKKVERIGNLNYPQEARSQRVYGSLRLLVSINRDGTLYEVQILESSGQQVLDQAALRIVRLAAPFSPFIGDLADVDRLEIIRTWRFERGDRLSSN